MVNLPRWQIILVALVVLAGVIFAAPNLLLTREQATRMADEGSILPHQQISLGLDLRGGVYLLVGVDLSALMEQDRDNLQEGIRAAERGRPAEQRDRHRRRCRRGDPAERRSEEHTSELQSLMRMSYAVFCFKKKNIKYI